MILQIRTSAGACLLERPESPDRPPCANCLQTRLVEAGFSVLSTFEPVEESSLGEPLIRSLARGDGRNAPVVRLDEGKAFLHSLLPVPNCPVCLSRQGVQEGTERRPPLPADVLKDPLLGMTSMFEFRDMDQDPKLLCSAVRGRIHLPDASESDHSFGMGATVDEAAASQLGEAVERYCGSRPEHARLIASTSRAWGDQTIPVRAWRGYDRDQLERLGYRAPQESLRLHWIEGRAIRDNRSLFVPAAAVFLRRSWDPGEVRLFPLVSHGLACHSSPEEARRRALLELYERYHLTAAWHRQTFGARIPENLLPPELRPVIERVRRSRLRLRLSALTLPPATTVALALLTGPTFPWITTGAAAKSLLGQAAGRAVLEACGGWQSIAGSSGPSDVPKALPELAGAGVHSLYHCRRDRAERVAAAIENGTEGAADPRTLEARSDIAEEILALSPQALTVRVTTPDVADCGLEVVRAVAPGLPLFQFGKAGTPRLFLDRFGLPRRKAPHPYP